VSSEQRAERQGPGVRDQVSGARGQELGANFLVVVASIQGSRRRYRKSPCRGGFKTRSYPKLSLSGIPTNWHERLACARGFNNLFPCRSFCHAVTRFPKTPSPLRGERAGVRGGKDPTASQGLAEANDRCRKTAVAPFAQPGTGRLEIPAAISGGSIYCRFYLRRVKRCHRSGWRATCRKGRT
jgi:hypothetical protein